MSLLDDNRVISYIIKLWNNYIITDPVNINRKQQNKLDKKNNMIKENIIKKSNDFNKNYTKIEKELELKETNNNEMKLIFKYYKSNNNIKKNIINKLYNFVFPKYKTGNKSDPENYRYLINHDNVIKFLDTKWNNDILILLHNKLPDPNIFKCPLKTNLNLNVVKTAMINTQSIDNVVLLDIKKAFDSLEWNIIKELLLSNLSRKIDPEVALKYVNEYMLILCNRKIYYKNNIIPISKGIPTGLPSSTTIFTLIMEEIVFRWKNKYIFHDYILNIYVDDIYFKINCINKNLIIFSFIKKLEKYKLIINFNKSKADKKLKINKLKVLKNTDFYLGIPFTRNIKLYLSLILQEYNKKNDTLLNINDIYMKLLLNDKKIFGYLYYKLYPVIENINKKKIINFIKKYKNNNSIILQILFIHFLFILYNILHVIYC